MMASKKIIKVEGFKFDHTFEGGYLELHAYDAEGKLYKSSKVRVFDEFVGHYYE